MSERARRQSGYEDEMKRASVMCWEKVGRLVVVGNECIVNTANWRSGKCDASRGDEGSQEETESLNLREEEKDLFSSRKMLVRSSERKEKAKNHSVLDR